MKKIISWIVLMCLVTPVLHSQVIYVSTLTNDIYRLDIKTCQLEHVAQTADELFDITFHPDGNFYGITPPGELVQVDTVTGAFTAIYDFPGDNFNSLTASANGVIYSIGSEGELWSYNTATAFVRYHGNVGFVAAGDLAFRNGQLYLAVVNDQIIQVDITDPQNSAVVINDNIPGDIYGIVSYAENCEAINTYAITDGASEIYEINFTTGRLEHVCSMNIEVGGGASTYEFLGSSGLAVDDASILPSNCFDQSGAAAFAITGGFGSLQFSIDGMNFQDTPVFTSLAGGDYTLTVTDSIGCMMSYPFSIMTSDGPAITALQVDAETCNADNGRLYVSATGGQPPILYALDDQPYQAIGEFNGLTAGAYTLHITDNVGCEADTIVQLGSVASPFFTQVEVQSTRCDSANGSVQILGASGSQPLLYELSGFPPQSSNVFSRLSAADYTITLIDRFGCTYEEAIAVMPSTQPSIDGVSIMHTACGLSNGSGLIEAANGTGELQYSIDGVAFKANPSFPNLPAGEYTFFVRDQAGCTALATARIESSRAVQLEALRVRTASCGEADGRIEFDLSAGSEVNVITLDGRTPDAPNTFLGLVVGNYALHLEDAAGCGLDTMLTVGEDICPLYIPNVFSPNGDGFNDFFALSGYSGYDVFIQRYIIFDRWGNVMMEASGFPLPDGGSYWWDGIANGKDAPGGVYAYRIAVVYENGTARTYTGDVTLMR